MVKLYWHPPRQYWNCMTPTPTVALCTTPIVSSPHWNPFLQILTQILPSRFEPDDRRGKYLALLCNYITCHPFGRMCVCKYVSMCLCRAANQISVQTGLTDKGEFGGKLFSLFAASFFIILSSFLLLLLLLKRHKWNRNRRKMRRSRFIPLE